MNLGSVFFAQPLALLGLLALPVILWLLRATPPEPKRVVLPSLSLLDDVDQIEETPAKTPWWILALRFAAAALAIIGFSQPLMQSPQSNTQNMQSALIVVDNGWASTEQWNDIKQTILSASDAISDNGGSIHLAFTAPSTLTSDINQALGVDEVRKRLQIEKPAPWNPDHNALLDRIEKSSLNPSKIIWLSDGLEHNGSQAFNSYLEKASAVEIYKFAPRSAYAITNAETSSNGANVYLKRLASETAIEARVIAESESGLSLASAIATFTPNTTQAVAEFSIPSAILNQIARFRVLGSASAGQVWLWDDSSATPSVALADPVPSDQPLLEEFYYIRKALSPHAQMMEGELSQMLSRSPDAIILGDRSLIGYPHLTELEDWIEEGGALIRFAGPKLAAAESHTLTPSPLRSATRALGGALAWEEPQSIAPFIATKGFADIKTPADSILVRRQVLAQPSPELAAYTWAKLADGTPLVTARSYGKGLIVLFHVTATPEWSDLPYDGAFVSMLRRAAASGNGKRNTQSVSTGTLAPFRLVDAFGQLKLPSGNLEPLSAEAFSITTPSPLSPPGLYQGPQGSRAINAGAFAAEEIQSLASNAVVFDEALSQKRRGLGGVFLMAAFGLLFLDLVVALLISGRFRRFSKSASFALILFMGASVFVDQPSQAQTEAAPKAPISKKQKEAALQMRFAYVETNNPALNMQLAAGLRGLNLELFRRTSVEPATPHSVKLGIDALDLYPMIYFAPERDATALTADQIDALNSYLRNGGSLVIDTRDAIPGQAVSARLKNIIQGLDVPPLQPTPNEHVLSRSFYLLNSFPGRLASGQVWIEAQNSASTSSGGDRVSRIYIGASDWIGAWAIDDNNRPLNSMDGQESRREIAYRFGINLIMCILTGNYKEDQVHIPALLERLDAENANEPNSKPTRERTIIPSPSTGNPQNLDEFFDSMRRKRDQQGLDTQE